MRKQMEALIEEMLDGSILLAEAIGEFEKIYIQKALAQNDHHLGRTAATLGIHRNTLSNRLSLYNGAKPTKLVTSRNRSASKRKTHIKKVKTRAAASSR